MFALQVFYGPVKGSCPLLHLPDAQIVLLDDFRPDGQLLDIATLLMWFEGGAITIARPLNCYQTHLQFQATQPHFATCSFASLHAARGKVTDTELSMLRSRMKLYVFQKRLEEVRDLPCCVNCFAMWILSAGGNVAKFLAKGFPAVDG